MIWLRTALFTLLVPGTVMGVVPFALIVSGVGPHFDLGGGRFLGLVPLILGLAIILWCFADFVQRGQGTPSPHDPPRKLVSAGLYRFVRNPQYVGVVLVILGETLLSGAGVLFGYAALMALIYSLFVRFYEEPHLRWLFGDEYVRFCEETPRWMPRRRSDC